MGASPSKDRASLPISREGVDILLSKRATPFALTCRIRALQQTADDIQRFCPWPALEASLRQDAVRLTNALKEKA